MKNSKSDLKKFKMWKTIIGECMITPMGTPVDHPQFLQPIECCFTATDPTGQMLNTMIKKSGSPDNVPKFIIGRLLDQLFGLTGFDTYGITVIECHGSNGNEQTIHIHTNGTVNPFDLQSWNDTIMLTDILSECGIKRAKS